MSQQPEAATPVSWVNIKGDWLKKWGLTVGYKVTVLVQEGSILFKVR